MKFVTLATLSCLIGNADALDVVSTTRPLDKSVPEVKHITAATQEQLCEDAMIETCGEFTDETKPIFLECVFKHRENLSEICRVKTAWPASTACSAKENELCGAHPGESSITDCITVHYNELTPKCIKQFLRDHTAFLCLDDVNRLCRPQPGLSVLECLANKRDELSDKCHEHTVAMGKLLVPKKSGSPAHEAPIASSPEALSEQIESPAPTRPPTTQIMNLLSKAPASSEGADELHAASFVAQMMASALPKGADAEQSIKAEDVDTWIKMAAVGGVGALGVVGVVLAVAHTVSKKSKSSNGLDTPLVAAEGGTAVELPTTEAAPTESA